ncbi:MAG: ATP synthase F1 subunit delta [Bacteroidales bacterium]|nr:ATP synthase F1 subunit delta [Bacteroidales bacterium]MBP5613873.1 ATP synthase F1 subunit delta [Bacteroidales bacterium]
MKRTKLAARYAKALFDFAKERNEVEEISRDIMLIDDTFDNNPELRFTFNSPIVHSDKKAAILRDLFESRVSEPSFRYLMLILRKGRELQLDTICSEYVKIYKVSKNIVTMDVYTAQPMDSETLEKLKAKLAGVTQANIEAVEHVDPSLIGGIVVKYGDYMVDASIRQSISKLQRELTDKSYQVNF